MRWLSRLRFRLRSLFGRGRLDREMDAELHFHLDQQVRALVAEGIPEEEARRLAARRFGPLTRVKEECRDQTRVRWLESLARDLRLGARNLRRSPGLVAVSVASLALGIGPNAYLYTGLDTVFRHRPTMTEPSRVVGVEPGNSNQFSYLNYRDLRDSGIFRDTLGFRLTFLDQRDGDFTRRVSALAVTDNFFEALGVSAALGRTFTSEGAALEGEPRLVVLGDSYWRNHLAADPDVVGRQIQLGGEPFTVVGVLGAGHRAITGFMGPALYVPLSRLVLPAADERGSPSLTVLARLQPGSTAGQAQAAVTLFAQALERLDPQRNEGLGEPARVFPAAQIQFRGTPPGFSLLAILMAAIFGLVLLIGAANVAGLLLARAAHRRHELALHVALGAGRRRLVQSLLVEAFLLSSAGALAGIGIALALGKVSAPGLSGILRAAGAPDARLLLYALALIALTTLVAGVVPALRATRGDLIGEIRQRTAGGTRGNLWLRHSFVAGQVALSLTLLVIAALCLRSQLRIATLDLGFDLDRGVVARLRLEPGRDTAAERARLAERLVDRLATVPGIASASVADLVPLGGDSLVASFHPAGRTDLPGTRPAVYSVGPRYFETLGIPVVAGRELDAGDRAGGQVVAVVNETFARTHFPDRRVIGLTVQTADEPEAVIVGVVRDHRLDTIGETPRSAIYYPFAQRPSRVIVHARAEGSPAALVTAVAAAIREVDASASASVQTLAGATRMELDMRRSATAIVGAIGGVGVLLMLVGLYGVMAYVVAARTAEVGIRRVLGATSGRLLLGVLAQACALVTAGIAAGAVLAALLTPALATFLAGLSPFDPVAYLATALLLLAAGMAASLGPAWRAIRVDPAETLRES
ncbi:MAG TPA: ADOP family duplicated permease [Thermoanaerobaculia bacterium]|nr:ADOP family duplicated permease [Thermoanaerobaculia bacterium]